MSLAALAAAAAFAGSVPAIEPPAPIACPELTYPPGLDIGAQDVDVEIELDEFGFVVQTTLVAGAEPFAGAVLDAIPRCVFSPATEDGQPIGVVIPFRWSFPALPPELVGQLVGPDGPLPGVVVQIGSTSVVTDAAGRFELHGIGEVAITADLPGYRVGSRTVALVPGTTLEVTLGATPIEAIPEAVGAYTTDLVSVSRLDAAAIKARPGSLGDPVRALQNEPGLVRTPFDAGWLLVRGGGPDDTAVLVEGVRTPLLMHLGGLASVVHPAWVESVELRGGGVPAKYGDTLAGVATVELRPPSGFEAGGGFNIAFAHADVSVPLGDVTVGAAIRRSYLDGMLALVIGKERARIAPKFSDAALRIDAPRVSVVVLGLSDALDAPTGSDDDDVVTIHQRSVQLQAAIEALRGPFDLTIRPYVATRDQVIGTSVRNEVDGDQRAGTRIETRWERGSTVLESGVEGELRRYHVARDGLVRQGPYGRIEPYAEAATGKTVRGSIGLRVDNLLAKGRYPAFAPSPRASVRIGLPRGFAVFAEAGRLHRLPSGLFLIGFDEGAYLQLPQSDYATLGFDHQGPVRGRFELWARATSRVAGFEKDGSLGQLSGRAFGADAFAEGTLSGFDLRGTVSVQKAQVREELGDPWELTRYDETVVTELMGHRRVKGLDLTARFRFASGYPLADGTDDAYDILRQESVPLEPDRHGRLADYHALDLRVGRIWELKHLQIEAFLDVLDVYGRRVPEPAINGIDDTETAYGFGLPILPLFGVEGRSRVSKPVDPH